ncbi:uncharacterized protein K02A2.6-like [Cydia pomonella]|uniref:uncharacterized protein K02A2.6-like n=2 Tax=Cydia pomonella TaxID=82600 RepID=UPI002ADD6CC6|nr:uncharacterized protein K02A2.6-like [Cydia pomonella]
MSIGKIGEFKIASDNWRLYVERLEQYFLCNNIKAELQVPTLVTVIGAECYELLVNLCTPDKPTSKTFAELTTILEKHLQPKPSVLAERYKFRHRKQGDSESMSNYVAVLKRMSKTCDFGAWLEESLRDQFVCGIHSETIRQRLFAEDKLDFTKAFNLAVSMEAAEKDAAMVEGSRKPASDGTSAAASCQAISASSSRRRSEAARGAWQPRGAERGASAGRGARASGWQAAASAGKRRDTHCNACGGTHGTETCRFTRYVCKVCNKQGHLQRVCPLMVDTHSVDVMNMASQRETYSENSDMSDEVIIIHVNNLRAEDYKPIFMKIIVQGIDLDMECDTGSAISCVSKKVYEQLFSQLILEDSNVRLRYYTGELVKPVGVVKPLVKYKDRQEYLEMYVIENAKSILIGRQWLAELNIPIPTPCRPRSVNSTEVNDNEFNLAHFSSRFCDVFADGLGRFTGGRVSIHLREGARPVFLRARPLAYALRAPVERALEQLVRDGVLTPVDRSDWATPIVPVVKKDGNVRICADYKLTLNRMLEVDRYPLPRVEDLLARLYGGKRFSKIDLSQAYAQFELDDSRKYTVINTHKGLFRYNRLVYGLSSSPGIFQRRLEQMFADLPHVGVFLDDVIITGSDTESHIDNLVKVFERLQAYGLRVKKDKCAFFAKSINYLGHVISEDGIHTCPEKVKAIEAAPAPRNVSELRAFIGMVMYYAKFVGNVSSIMAPLYNLLKSGVKFVWDRECQAAFQEIKRALGSSQVLTHYSEKLPLILTCDASGVGVASVISHATEHGERPVAYASRTLSAAERAYAQIDREALAIVYGIRKFHQYLYGRKFILRTDHKPLTYIFGDKVGIPVMAASRIQRWAVLLSGYDYQIEYVTSKRNCADALSRLPQGKEGGLNRQEEVTYVNFVESFLPVTNNDVRVSTARDRIVSRVITYAQSGWPASCPDEEMEPYFIRRNELYVDRGCLMWGYRMTIPNALREKILKQLHTSHMGIVKMKSQARSYVWWPNIDADVEALCRACETCAAEAAAPPRATPSPWMYVTQPWTRIHVDFLQYKGRTYLILTDSSSKWIEVFEMSRTNSSAVIRELRATFARFGLPSVVVSDQGPPFTSAEFKQFLTQNGIEQAFSPVYHPASNGAAEQAVKLCKRAIKKAFRDGVDVDMALQTYLLAYRNSVHSTTGETPAMLLQKRNLRSRLDLLRSDRGLEDRVRDAQRRQVQAAQSAISERNLATGDTVWARNYTGADKWIKGTVVGKEGSRRYTLDNGDGRLLVRHVDQIRRRSALSSIPCPTERGADGDEQAEQLESPKVQQGGLVELGEEGTETVREEEPSKTSDEIVTANPSPRPQLPARSPVALRPLPSRRHRLEID